MFLCYIIRYKKRTI